MLRRCVKSSRLRRRRKRAGLVDRDQSQPRCLLPLRQFLHRSKQHMTRLDSESLPFSVVWLLAEPEHWQLTVFFIQPTLQALALPPPFLQKQRTTFNCPLIRPFLLSPLF